MIARLEGRLAEKRPEGVILDVGGVGYEVRVPVSTFLALPDEGKTLRLRIYTYVREDTLALYGFLTDRERVVFGLLLGINGVGPRLALAILSGLPAEQLGDVVRRGDVSVLRSIPGVGAKTADRMLIELRDKVDRIEPEPRQASSSSAQSQALSALLNLGYPRAHADAAVRSALERLPGDPTLETLIREALRDAVR
ncbi:MAG: Holliday junction branch migration protein RuvA [Myxococcota bacterium]|nr:Holliday junction branch migration protein RuvA [Myxococcota bacterium]